MAEERILFVINSKSGSGDNNDTADVIRELLKDKDYKFRIFLLSGNDDRQKIVNEIDSFRPSIVAAGGGDGTVNLVASLLIGTSVKLGIIPLGSANGLATELGIPEKLIDSVNLILNGQSLPMDVIRINEDHISLHLSDAGINARIVKEFENEGSRGIRGYARHLFRELLKPQKSFICRILIGNQVKTHRAYMVLIANASKYSSGANMNPRGEIDDGLFEIVVIKPSRSWAWKSLVGAFTGTLHRKPNIETYSCTSAVINIIPPQELQVDGEILGLNKEIRASIHKHALKIILPENKKSDMEKAVEHVPLLEPVVVK